MPSNGIGQGFRITDRQELRDGSDVSNLVVCSGMVPLTALTRHQGEMGEMSTGYFRYRLTTEGMNRATW